MTWHNVLDRGPWPTKKERFDGENTRAKTCTCIAYLGLWFTMGQHRSAISHLTKFLPLLVAVFVSIGLFFIVFVFFHGWAARNQRNWSIEWFIVRLRFVTLCYWVLVAQGKNFAVTMDSRIQQQINLNDVTFWRHQWRHVLASHVRGG